MGSKGNSTLTMNFVQVLVDRSVEPPVVVAIEGDVGVAAPAVNFTFETTEGGAGYLPTMTWVPGSKYWEMSPGGAGVLGGVVLLWEGVLVCGRTGYSVAIRASNDSDTFTSPKMFATGVVV